MSILTWNVRGFNASYKQSSIVTRLLSLHLDVICLLETKIKQQNFNKVVGRRFQQWDFLHNYASDQNGRIWVFWKRPAKVRLVSECDQAISCLISINSMEFLASFIYAKNDYVSRRKLWEYLVSVKTNSIPWMISGDFNILNHPSECSKYDGRQIVNMEIQEFLDCQQEIGVADHFSSGCFYTWSNKQEENFQARKLDRVLVNASWFDSFASSVVEFLAPGESDHSPSILKLDMGAIKLVRPFKLFKHVIKHVDFLEVVKESWQAQEEGDPMQILHRKMKRLKPVLRAFSKTHFSNISERVLKARQKLEMVQNEILKWPTNNQLIQHEKELSVKLFELLIAEESLYRQKSRIQWLKEGDQNTKFFHSTVKFRQKAQSFIGIKDLNGVTCTNHEQVAAAAINFFQNLIGKIDTDVERCPITFLKELLPNSLPLDAVTELDRPIEISEIKDALFSIGDDKAPGPDGFPAIFFKVAWEVISADVTNAMLHFFSTSKMNPGFNSTSIALVPKKSHVSDMSELRPIACCTVIYKTATQLLANRMKKFMPGLISKCQGAFIKGRDISDNILLAQELVKGYRRSSLSPRCMLKVDIKKAFDSVSWNFILDMLEAMGFSSKFIGWIAACITTPKFSISVHGSLEGYFKGEKGIRQGDPLSPFLFVIVMEMLSALLDTAVINGVFRFHPKCKRLNLTHLCFADDLLIFVRGDIDSIEGVQNILNFFYNFSGLKINPSKCELYTSGISEGIIDEMQRITGFEKGNLPVRYLGVPLITRKLSYADCEILIDKVRSKISGWASKTLSFAGRFQLIQAVLYSLQVFWCRHFLIPKKVLQDIEKLCCRFFWTGSDQKATGARVSWEAICHPKAEGGLGLRDLVTWNRAYFMKGL